MFISKMFWPIIIAFIGFCAGHHWALNNDTSDISSILKRGQDLATRQTAKLMKSPAATMLEFKSEIETKAVDLKDEIVVQLSQLKDKAQKAAHAKQRQTKLEGEDE